MTHKEKILALAHGETYFLDAGEESGAEIRYDFIRNGVDLYEIPQYGGNPLYVGFFPIEAVDDLIAMVESWT